ncbi:hypothetical protein BH10ACT11_BH10ACT11_09330 [soil metagenome]
MTDPLAEAAPRMKAFAARHRLIYEDAEFLPNVTQLLRRDYSTRAQNMLSWEMPGEGPTGARGRLAHASYRRPVGNGRYEDAWFTVVLLPAPASVGFAKRILCHDRRLDKVSSSNPDLEGQIVEVDDEAVKLESEAFAARYALHVDHDEDELTLWQLFDPAVVEWLTEQAPPELSLELEPGLLCCFLPGVRSDGDDLEGLLGASELLGRRIEEIGDERRPAAAPGTRGELFERELAEHPTDAPFESVEAAAHLFQRRPVFHLHDRAWHLGSEAFFRAYVASIAMKPRPIAELSASHFEAGLVGDPVRAARGVLPGTELEGFLVLSNLHDADDSGWIEILADVPEDSNTYAFTAADEYKKAQKLEIDIDGTATAICMWKADEGERGRTLAGVIEFMDFSAPALARIVAISVR